MLSTITTIARDAGQKILAHYGQNIPVDHKADDSPLTQADLAAHHHILAALTALAPDIPVVSEEGVLPDPATIGPRFWVVDPLDGTKEFIHQRGSFTVNIALIENGIPVLGVVHAPALDETYHAEKGQGAWHTAKSEAPKPIKVSPVAGASSPGPSRGHLAPEAQSTKHKEPTTVAQPLRIVASRDHAGPEVTALLARFPDASCLSIGSSLKFCLVAAGQADAYLRDVPTMEWDTAAAHAILLEAGGILVQWPNLEPLPYAKPTWRNGPILSCSSLELALTLAR
jgi:3'(2'), 5'-bisphosphate nucleotidase